MFASIVSKASFGDVEPTFIGTVLAGIEDRYKYQSTKAVQGECVHLIRDDSDEDDPNVIKVLNRNLEMLGHLDPRVAEEIAQPIDFGDLLVCGRILEMIEPACEMTQPANFMDYLLLWVYEIPRRYHLESWPPDDEVEVEALPEGTDSSSDRK